MAINSQNDRITEPEQEITRRGLLFLGGIGVGALIMKLIKQAPEDSRAKSIQREYEQTGTIEDIEGFQRVLVEVEWNVLQKAGDPSGRTLTKDQEHVDNFIDRVQATFVRRLTMEPRIEGRNRSTVDNLNLLKLCFEEQYNDGTQYNKYHDSIVHIPHGRLQCDNARRLFLISVMRILGESIGTDETLITVSSVGGNDVSHSEPGLITNSGEIYTLNMTQLGPNATYIGDRDTPPEDIAIDRAVDSLANSALGTPLPAPIVDTIKPRSGKSTDTSGHFGSPRAFGTGTQEAGDFPLGTSGSVNSIQKSDATKVQYLLENVAPRYAPTKAYLQLLPEVNRLYASVINALGVAATNPESLSDAELLRIVKSAETALDRLRRFDEQNNLNVLADQVAIAAEVPGALSKYQEEQQRKQNENGRTIIYSTETIDLGLPDRKADIDPIFDKLRKAESACINLRIYIFNERRSIANQLNNQ